MYFFVSLPHLDDEKQLEREVVLLGGAEDNRKNEDDAIERKTEKQVVGFADTR